MMNFYPFHVGDYAAHTKHLTLMEDLAYRRLIDLYYIQEAPLPGDAAKVARLIGMRDHLQVVSDVLSDFFLISEGFYINKRCDAEIEKYKGKANRAKNANKSRWKSETNLKSDVKSDLISDADKIPTNNQEPITNNHKPNIKTTTRKRVDPAKPDDVSDSVWFDFLEIRKTKRSPITETALSVIRKEAKKAGMTLQNALEQCCARGWQGFKADWLKDSTSTNHYETAYQRSMRERAQELAPGVARKAPGSVGNTFENFIEEVRHVASIECN